MGKAQRASTEQAEPEQRVEEPLRAEVIPEGESPLPPPPSTPLERSTVAWLAYLVLQHLLWLFAALRAAPKPPKGPA